MREKKEGFVRVGRDFLYFSILSLEIRKRVLLLFN